MASDDLDTRIREDIPKHGAGAERLHRALYAVLDEHTSRDGVYCDVCIEGCEPYEPPCYEPCPCPTVRLIASALGVEAGDE